MIIINDHMGNPVEVFLTPKANGYIGKTRSKDRATFETIAERRGLMRRDDDGNLAPSNGVQLFEVPPPALVEPVFDDDGNITTPGVYDTRYHCDIFIGEPALSVPDDTHEELMKWQVTAIMWSQYGAVDENQNANEVARVIMDVALIDDRTINSFSNGIA